MNVIPESTVSAVTLTVRTGMAGNVVFYLILLSFSTTIGCFTIKFCPTGSVEVMGGANAITAFVMRAGLMKLVAAP